MKYLLSAFVTILFLSFIACKPQQKPEKDTISVSIEPQRYFMEQIVGDKYNVNTVIPDGSNPETYDPSPSQMVNIGKSGIYFKIGKLGFEDTWLKNVMANSPDMKMVDCSVGIPVIHDGEHHGDDPHIWSSPKTASLVVKNMFKGLTEYDKENHDYYLERYKNVEKMILGTDSIIRSKLAQSSSKAFVIYHPSLSYFANEYSLKQYSIESHGKSPSPQHMAQLIRQAKEDNVKVVFIQQEFDMKNAETVAKELNAKVVPVNPLSYDWQEEMIKIATAIAE